MWKHLISSLSKSLKDKFTTDASKARLKDLASLAKRSKSVHIQGILAHGPTVRVAPQIIDQDQDELGTSLKHKSN